MASKSIIDASFKPAFKAWIALWYLFYVLLRVALRLTIGKARRQYVQDILGLHYSRAYNAIYGDFLGRHHEPHIRKIIKQHLRNGGVFIDVGAYLGYFSNYAYQLVRRKGGLVIAVEPDPENHSVLLRERVSNEIEVVNAAIWVKDGTVNLRRGKSRHSARHLSSERVSDSSTLVITQHHKERNLLSNELVSVNSIRLDTLIKQFNLRQVDLVKMDIEGAEYYVLTDPGLDLSKVKAMVVEVHYSFTSPQSKTIISSLKSKGFKLYPFFIQDKRRYHLYAVKTGQKS